MKQYRIRKDGENVTDHLSTETDMRFALAEWLFIAGHDIETGRYIEKEEGYSIVALGHRFEIQPAQLLLPVE